MRSEAEELAVCHAGQHVETRRRPPRQALPLQPRGHFYRDKKGDVFKKVDKEPEKRNREEPEKQLTRGVKPDSLRGGVPLIP
jgi:hypothetical protein